VSFQDDEDKLNALAEIIVVCFNLSAEGTESLQSGAPEPLEINTYPLSPEAIGA
jgi:hypothetical protein